MNRRILHRRDIIVKGSKKRKIPIRITVPMSLSVEELTEVKELLNKVIAVRRLGDINKKRRKQYIEKKKGSTFKRMLKGFEKKVDEEIEDIKIRKKNNRNKYLHEMDE